MSERAAGYLNLVSAVFETDPQICAVVHPLAETFAKAAGRFWAKVDTSGDCWLWTACRVRKGYGRFFVAGHLPPVMYAHDFAFELLVGPIPDGMGLDHLCHTANGTCEGGSSCQHRRCVNPVHLEPVTTRVNVLRGLSRSGLNARKTHCQHGHAFTPQNTKVSRAGERRCRTCERLGQPQKNRARRTARQQARMDAAHEGPHCFDATAISVQEETHV